MREESFGSLLRYYRRRARDLMDGGSLSQDRLADLLSQESGIIYSRGAVSDWERGKGHIHKDARHLLVSLLRVLVEAGGIHARDEADAWLAAGNYRALNAQEVAQIAQVVAHSAEWQPGTARDQHDRAIFMAPALPPHTIVGRDVLLDTLRQQLFAGHNLALSAINGLPGVGKTTLAALLAHDAAVREHFPDGVLWVGLGRDPDLFHQLGVWARAVGVDSAELERMGAVRLRANAVHAAIRDKRMLLIIDDVWDDAPVRLFKVGGSACAHVLTTRQPRIAAGFAGSHALKVTELSDAYAFELLRQLAPRVVAEEPEAAREVVRACGGLPLALVLVGNYLRIQAATGQGRRIRSALVQMQSAEKRLHIQRSQSILTQEGHPSLPDDAPLSLATIINVSDEELSAEARAALRALALFPPKPNSFSEEAALSVSGATVDELDALSDHGLLETAGRERYALHQSIAEYACLEAPPLSAQRHYLRYYIRFSQAHQDDHNALASELDNLTTALEMARHVGRADLLYQLMDALFGFLDAKGQYDLASTYLVWLLDSDLGLAEMARVWLHFGRIAYKRNDRIRATEQWEQGLSLARAADAHDEAIELLSNLSIVASESQDNKRARMYLQESLRHARATQNWTELCRSLANLGRLALISERYAEADRFLANALVIAQDHGFDNFACAVLNMRGMAAMNRGDYPAALESYQDGLKLARENRFRTRTLGLLLNAGQLLTNIAHYDDAIAYLEEGLALAQQVQDRAKEAYLLMNLGVVAAETGQRDSAESRFAESYQIASDSDNRWLMAYVSAQAGLASVRFGRIESATRQFEQSLSLADSLDNNREVIALNQFGLAQLAHRRGDRADAAARVATCVQVLQGTGHALLEKIETWRAENGYAPDIAG